MLKFIQLNLTDDFNLLFSDLVPRPPLYFSIVEVKSFFTIWKGSILQFQPIDLQYVCTAFSQIKLKFRKRVFFLSFDSNQLPIHPCQLELWRRTAAYCYPDHLTNNFS